ncbi:response regulator [Nostoc sp. UHCC 0702]|nr:response regulator [Nostoc sp. UHCC 0702]
MLILINYIFEIYGIKVITTSSASEALEIMKECEVQLLITDIAMPEEDGFSLIRKIRTLMHPQKRAIPAIAFTGSTGNQVHEKTLGSEFQAYIKKPSDPIQLITEVAKLLRRFPENNSLLVSNYSYLEEEKVA